MKVRNDSGSILPIDDVGKSLDNNQELELLSLPLDNVYRSAQSGGDIYTKVGTGQLVLLANDGQPLPVPAAIQALEQGAVSPIELNNITTINYVPVFYDPFRMKSLSVETRDLFYYSDTATTFEFAKPLGSDRPLRTYHIPRDATIVECAFYALNFTGPFYLYCQAIGGAWNFLLFDANTTPETDKVLLNDGVNINLPTNSLLRVYLIPYDGGSLSTVEITLKLRWNAT